MTSLNDKYDKVQSEYSDIYLHIPRLKEIAEECETITEMGTRDVVSTWAFASAHPRKITCIDIHRSDNVNELEAILNENNIEFEFLQENTLTVEINECDLLFIDTFHTYTQLRQELQRHGNKAQKYLAFHDTHIFAHTSEDHDKERGLVDAIDEFLENNPQWRKYKVYEDNNGLTILRRYTADHAIDDGNGFCIATFCIFERYRKSAIQKLIKSCPKDITIILGTDKPSDFEHFDNVKTFNMNEYVDTNTISNSYYDFDFSIKRYALEEAVKRGFSKVLLCDCDTVIENSESLKTAVSGVTDIDTITGFSGLYKNSPSSIDQSRMLEYLRFLNIDCDDFANVYDTISEDLQQLFFMSKRSYDIFLKNLDRLFEYKRNHTMNESTRGVLVEIALAGYMSGIKPNKLCTGSGIYADHTKWYATKGTVLNDVKIVTCIYAHAADIYKGHTTKHPHFIASLKSKVLHMPTQFAIYCAYKDYDILKEVNAFEGKTIIRELNDFNLPMITHLKHQYNEEGSRRSLYIQWAKFLMLEEQVKDMIDEQRIYWIDAGLSYPGLFPKKYNPNIDEKERYEYTIPNLNRNHNFSLLFNEQFATNLTSIDKILVINNESESPEDGWVNEKNPHYSRVIGGFFGGRVREMKLLVQLFKYELFNLLEQGKCKSEEAILTHIVNKYPHLFCVKNFNTWHYEDSDHGRPTGNKSFYMVFEEILNA